MHLDLSIPAHNLSSPSDLPRSLTPLFEVLPPYHLWAAHSLPLPHTLSVIIAIVVLSATVDRVTVSYLQLLQLSPQQRNLLDLCLPHCQQFIFSSLGSFQLCLSCLGNE